MGTAFRNGARVDPLRLPDATGGPMVEPFRVRVVSGGEKSIAAAFLVAISRGGGRGLWVETEAGQIILSFDRRDDVIAAIRSLEAATALEGGLAAGAEALKADLEQLLGSNANSG